MAPTDENAARGGEGFERITDTERKGGEAADTDAADTGEDKGGADAAEGGGQQEQGTRPSQPTPVVDTAQGGK